MRHPVTFRLMVLATLPCLLALATAPARAVERDVYKEVRDQYEGMTYKLRVDLDQMTGAKPPNVVSLEGVGHGREHAPVLFGQLDEVFVQRVSNDGATRLELTIYRTRNEANRFRASAVPQPGYPGSNYSRTLGAFAQLGSTSVLLELKAGRKDPEAQLREVETLLDRIFYLSGKPSQEDLQDFVRRHRGMPLQRLRDLTGLDSETIRGLIEEGEAPTAPAAAAPPGPAPLPASPPGPAPSASPASTPAP